MGTRVKKAWARVDGIIMGVFGRGLCIVEVLVGCVLVEGVRVIEVGQREGLSMFRLRSSSIIRMDHLRCCSPERLVRDDESKILDFR